MSALQKSQIENNKADSNLANALVRLNNALDLLDKTIDDSLDARSAVHSADEEVQRMAEDRTKLAKELDEAQARANRLSDANKEVSKRLVGAMETVRGVLDQSA